MTHTCPRRQESPRPEAYGGLGSDEYATGHGLVGQARGCSYCGSMSPDDFMQAVRDGKVIGPTDKSYKVYVTEPLSELQRAQRRREQIGRYVGMGMSQPAATEQADKDPVLGEGSSIGKFYFGHLSEEQGSEFKRLYAEGKVAMGYPGHFYRPVYLPLLPEDRPAPPTP